MFWPTRPPREIAKYAYFRPFWPRTARGTYRNPGRGLKTEKRIFPALGVPKSKKKKLPHFPGWLSTNFFTFYVLAGRKPAGGETQNAGGFRPFWPRTALGEKFRAENRTTQTASLRPKRDKQTPFSSVLIPALIAQYPHWFIGQRGRTFPT